MTTSDSQEPQNGSHHHLFFDVYITCVFELKSNSIVATAVVGAEVECKGICG